MFKHTLKLGDRLQIGGAVVRLEKKSGQVACLVIEADPSIKVRRLGPQEDQNNDKSKFDVT